MYFYCMQSALTMQSLGGGIVVTRRILVAISPRKVRLPPNFLTELGWYFLPVSCTVWARDEILAQTLLVVSLGPTAPRDNDAYHSIEMFC